MAKTDHVAAHKHSSRHRAEIEASGICGCFYCLLVFPPFQIVEWIDGPIGKPDELGVTALCPGCAIDAVIGSASGYPITVEFLRRMKQHWFHI